MLKVTAGFGTTKKAEDPASFSADQDEKWQSGDREEPEEADTQEKSPCQVHQLEEILSAFDDVVG